METWSTHHLYQLASSTLGLRKAGSLQRYAQQLTLKKLAVVFTLGHLSKITGVTYKVLRDSVNRKREAANYRMYAVKKRSGGRRFIHSVSKDLFKVQRFVNKEILQNCIPHSSSFAFHKSGGIRQCATMHCGARWLFQFDLTDFFYDITEIDAYRIFQSLGYRNLLAFELARLCTTTHLPQRLNRLLFHNASRHHFGLDSTLHGKGSGHERSTLSYPEIIGRVGVLPQGAPTSPMLSNLAARRLDESLHLYALDYGFVYTRYADDITISASTIPTQQSVGDIHRCIVRRIREAGFRENRKKTRVAGPGSKKVVLGLLVDGEEPRISRETYRRIDRHLYATEKFGLHDTASHEGFESAFGFFNHLSGLIAFVKDVDEERWEAFSNRFKKIDKPWL